MGTFKTGYTERGISVSETLVPRVFGHIFLNFVRWVVLDLVQVKLIFLVLYQNSKHGFLVRNCVRKAFQNGPDQSESTN